MNIGFSTCLQAKLYLFSPVAFLGMRSLGLSMTSQHTAFTCLLCYAQAHHFCTLSLSPHESKQCPIWREFLLISGKHLFTLQFPIPFSVLLGARKQKERAQAHDCAQVKRTTGRTFLWLGGSSQVAAEILFFIMGYYSRPCYINYSITSSKFWIPPHIWS